MTKYFYLGDIDHVINKTVDITVAIAVGLYCCRFFLPFSYFLTMPCSVIVNRFVCYARFNFIFMEI